MLESTGARSWLVAKQKCYETSGKTIYECPQYMVRLNTGSINNSNECIFMVVMNVDWLSIFLLIA